MAVLLRLVASLTCLVLLQWPLLMESPAALAENQRRPEDLKFGKYTGKVESAAVSKWLELDNRAREELAGGDYGAAEKSFKEALQAAESASSIYPGVINSLLGLSLLYEKMGSRGEAERTYELGMRTAESLWGAQSLRFAYLMIDLAWLYHWHGKESGAETLFLRAIKTEESSGQESSVLVELLSEYQLYLKECGRVAESERIMHRIEHLQGKLSQP
ncbi:MAG: hypothetical protein IPK73_12620 [Candidatus Obscuribacter sp.]|nr:hypothetical protein [Candidatus Obscuribacter sp.]